MKRGVPLRILYFRAGPKPHQQPHDLLVASSAGDVERGALHLIPVPNLVQVEKSMFLQFHGILTEAELKSYSKKSQIKEYDIILPSVHDPSRVSKRSVDSTNHNEAHKVTFTAFEEDHHVLLEKNSWLLRPDLEVEYLQPDGSIRKEPVQTRDCHFFATSVSHPGSTGALSTCNGLRGALSVNDEMLYIEPLKEDHTRRMKRSTEDAAQPHIIYKRSASEEDEFPCPITKPRVDYSGGQNGETIPANETVYTGPYLGAKYLEIYYVVDSLVYDEYMNDTESYAMTIMNIMSRRFAAPSLDISMRISVVRFLISMTEAITATSTTGGQVTFTPTTNGDTTLDDFCAWQASQSVDNDTNTDDWDLAILLTGHDIASNGADPGLLGLAFTPGACELNRKCSINENNGLAAGLTMAHETGHNLGVLHDIDYGCTPGRNIMSASASATNGSFEWSSCSREHMKIFISSAVCMDDIPSFPLSPIDVLPGQMYTVDEQCQMTLANPSATSCSFTTCAKLYCSLPGDGFCSVAAPPAEGTPCGEGLWCVNAACVNNTLNVTVPVDGGWTEYGDFTPCSRTCGTGVQYRSRNCTNPTPQWGGMPCEGESRIYMLCNEQLCETSQDDFRDEQCVATNPIELNGMLYNWTDWYASITGDDLCKLNCISSSNLVDDRPGDFCDGTQCWDDDITDVKSTKLCIGGLCQNFGCDGVLNSGLLYDDCRVCGGDGTSCNCTTGSADTRMGNDLEAVYVTIPVGSTSITADTYGSNQAVGLRVNGTFIFGIDTNNGNTITSQGRYTVGNMIVDYDYASNVNSHLRSLTEPSTETLDIIVWAGSPSINFTYRYCNPAPIQPSSSSSAFMMSTSSVEIALSSTSPSISMTASSVEMATASSFPSNSTVSTFDAMSSTPVMSDSLGSGPISTPSDVASSTAMRTSQSSESMSSTMATVTVSMQVTDSLDSSPMSTPSDAASSTAIPTSDSSQSMSSMMATDSADMPATDSLDASPMSTLSDPASATAPPTSESSQSMSSVVATGSVDMLATDPLDTSSMSTPVNPASSTTPPMSESSRSVSSVMTTDSVGMLATDSLNASPMSTPSDAASSTVAPTSQSSQSMSSVMATDSIGMRATDSLVASPISTRTGTASTATPSSESSQSMSTMMATDSVSIPATDSLDASPVSTPSDSASSTAPPTSESSQLMSSMMAADSVSVPATDSLDASPMSTPSDPASSAAPPTAESAQLMSSMMATGSADMPATGSLDASPMSTPSDPASLTLPPTSESSQAMSSVMATDSVGMLTTDSLDASPVSTPSDAASSPVTSTPQSSQLMSSMTATDSLDASPMSTSSDPASSTVTSTSESSQSMSSMTATDSVGMPSTDSLDASPMSTLTDTASSTATPASESTQSMSFMTATDSLDASPVSTSSAPASSTATSASESSQSMSSMTATDSVGMPSTDSLDASPMSTPTDTALSTATSTSESSQSLSSMTATDSAGMPATDSLEASPLSTPTDTASSTATPTPESTQSMSSVTATDSVSMPASDSLDGGPMSTPTDTASSTGTPTSESSQSMSSMSTTESLVASPMSTPSVMSQSMTSVLASASLAASQISTTSDMSTTATTSMGSSADVSTVATDGMSATPTPTPSSSQVVTTSAVPTPPTTPEPDPCDAAPCMNGGTCSTSGATYTCECPNTHTGMDCETAMCPVPVLTTGLEVDGCTAGGNAAEGDNCTYSCMSGYTINGDSMVTCGSNRMFSPPIPTCDAMCPVPALTTGLEVAGCTAEGNAVEGDTCTYSCMSGYTLNGDSMVTCGSNRMFSPPIPTCDVFDPCDATPCLNGATCSSADGTYTCMCPDTHTGSDCETEFDPCTSSPCQNEGSCSSSNAVYMCTCPSTHEGTNCETAKTACASTECGTLETCDATTGVCECAGNRVRNANGVCRRPRRVFTLRISVVQYISITNFENIVENPDSPESLEVRQRITIILFATYRRRYGIIFIGISITQWSLGSLDIGAELMFDEPESSSVIQPPTANEAAQVFMDSLINGSMTGDFVLNPSATTVTDENECSNSTLNDCSPFAECANTEGSYTCTCPEPGFIDTTPNTEPDRGRVCTDINECDNTSICSQFATCTNSLGSYSCSCFSGFTGDGQACTAVDDSPGLSDGAIAGLVIGSVSIVFLLLIILIALVVIVRRCSNGKPLARLAPFDGDREAIPLENSDRYGAGYPLADYPSDMDLGPKRKPGFSDGAYYSEAHYKEGFARPYMATGANGSGLYNEGYMEPNVERKRNGSTIYNDGYLQPDVERSRKGSTIYNSGYMQPDVERGRNGSVRD